MYKPLQKCLIVSKSLPESLFSNTQRTTDDAQDGVRPLRLDLEEREEGREEEGEGGREGGGGRGGNEVGTRRGERGEERRKISKCVASTKQYQLHLRTPLKTAPSQQ